MVPVLFTPGKNIAIKVPSSYYEATVAFYRNVFGFELKVHHDQATPSVSTPFGTQNHLWIDCVNAIPRGDVWLEIETTDLNEAKRRVVEGGGILRPEIEALPQGFGTWIVDPAGNTILLRSRKTQQAHLTGAIPQLPTGDILVTERFYIDILGFSRVAVYDQQGFLILSRDEAEIHFWLAPSEEIARTVGSGSSCYFRVQHVADLFEEFRQKSAPFAYELALQEWGMVEFQIADPFGAALRFGWPSS